MPSKKSRFRRRRGTLASRRATFQQLEDRRLLAGDLQPTVLTAEQQSLVHDGIDQIAVLLGDHSAAAESIAFFHDADGSDITIAEVADLETLVRDELSGPLADSWSSVSELSTADLVTRLGEIESVSDVVGGINPESGLIEVGFQFTSTLASTFDEVSWDFADATGVDLTSEQAIDATGSFEMRLDFAFDLERGLRGEQSFIVTNLAPSLSLSIDQSDVPVAATVGIFDANDSTIDIDLSTRFEFELNDEDGDGRATLAELDAAGSGLIAATSTVSTMDISVNVVAELADSSGTVTPPTGLVRVSGDPLDAESLTAELEDFESLAPLTHTESNEMLTALLNVADWMTLWVDSGLFEADIPHLSGIQLSHWTNPGPGLTEFYQTFVLPSGDANFTTVNDLAAALGTTFSYDFQTQELRLPITYVPQDTVFDVPVHVASTESPLKFAQTAIDVGHTVASSVTFDLVVDLEPEDSLTTARYSVDGLDLASGISASQANLSGTGVFGAIGFDFVQSNYDNTTAWSASIIHPTTGSSEVPILNLYDGLATPEVLISGGVVETTGDSNLELNRITILESLFSVDSATTNIQSTASWGASSEVASEGSDVLDRLGDITMDDVFRVIKDAYDTVVDLVDPAPPATEVVPFPIRDLVDESLQRVGIDGLVEVEQRLREVYGEAIKLQDISGDEFDEVFEDLDEVVDATIDVVIDPTTRAIKTYVDLVGETIDKTTDIVTDVADLVTRAGQDVVDTIGWNGSGAAVPVTTENSIDVDVEIIAPDQPGGDVEAFLIPTSGLRFEVFTDIPSGTPDSNTITGSLGPVNLELEDGAVVIAGDVDNPDPNVPATIHVWPNDDGGAGIPIGSGPATLDSSDIVVSGTGGIRTDHQVRKSESGTPEPIRLSVTIPSLATPEDLDFTVPDLASIINSIDLEDELASLPGDLDLLLGRLGRLLDGEVLGVKLPFVGDALSGFANAFEDLRLDLETVFEDLSAFDIDSILDKIQEIPGLAEDAVQLISSTPDDISMRVNWTKNLVNEVLDLQDVAIGGDAFGAALDGEFLLDVNLVAGLTIGVSRDLGFYTRTDDEDVRVDIDVFATRADDEFNLSGRLGLIEAGVYIDQVNGNALDPGELEQVFYTDYKIDLTEPSGDDRLTVAEANPAMFSADTVLNLDNETIVGGTGAGPGDSLTLQIVTQANTDQAQLMPSLLSDLVLDWHFEGIDLDGAIPDIQFQNVQIDVGQFVTNVLGSFLDELDFLLDPLEPVINIFESEITLVDDVYEGVRTILNDIKVLGKHPFNLPEEDYTFTLREVLAGVVEVVGPNSNLGTGLVALGALIDAFGLFIDLDTAINALEPPNDSLLIPVGDVLLRRELDGAYTTDFDLDEGIENVSGLHEILGGESLLAGIGDALNAFDANASELPEPGLEFPIFEDPRAIFNWLLGVDEVGLVAYQFPSIDLNFPVETEFPLFLGIVGVMGGSIGLEAQLGVGVDTYGISKFVDSNDPKDLAAGFYFSDRENPDGTGRDVPQVTIHGETFLGIGVGATGVSAELHGGISAEVNFDFVDTDGDGKIRPSETSAADPCLQIFGGVDLFARAEVDFTLKKFQFPIAEHPLIEFNTAYTCAGQRSDAVRPPNELGEVNNSILELYMGPDSSKRAIEPDQLNESFQVLSTGTSYLIEAFGHVHEIEDTGITAIRAFAGSGNDTITIDPSVTIPVQLFGGPGYNTFAGGGGDDTLIGGSGHNNFTGGEGNDSFRGGPGENWFIGGPGEDLLVAGTGFNHFDGGEDDDELRGSIGEDHLFGGPGNDTIETGGGGEDEVDGGEGDDRISGSPDAETIRGGAGNDTILGLAGNDLLFGDDGDDIINGGSGEDEIHGGNNADTLNGGSGDDRIYGGPGKDNIDGNLGDDELFGEGGGDIISDALGISYVEGGAGMDTITTGNFDDVIDGGPDKDLIRAGEGDDEVRGGNGDDEIYGEDGYDRLFGEGGQDSIYGGPNEDYIEGGDDDDLVLSGGDANDSIFGGPGDDFIFGDDGDDELHGDEGVDTIDGGLDNDTIYGGGSGDIIVGGPSTLGANRTLTDRDLIYGGPGDDTINGGADQDTIYGESGPDVIHGDDGPDLIYGGDDGDELHGDDGPDLIFGNDGPDSIFGGLDNDDLQGDEGDDYIEGNVGEDNIDGDTGNDHLVGGPGNDYIYGYTGKDRIEGNQGDDWLYGNDQDDLIFGDDDVDNADGGRGNDTIRGGNQDDVLLGARGNDLILGNKGNDVIFGEDGNDVIKGFDGDDILHGDDGRDHIDGEDGNDTIFGGLQDDILRGGSGNDFIDGEDGNDEVLGEDDADTLIGGLGDDYLMAGDGIGDSLDGGDGDDHLVGSPEGTQVSDPTAERYAGDVILGGPGDDFINALGGSDVIDAGTGDDLIYGGPGIDFITTGPVIDEKIESDDDTVYGGAHNDRINTNFGTDVAYGGGGDNSINGVIVPFDPTEPVLSPDFDMNSGLEIEGEWEQLSGSASADKTEGGLTRVGGFEQAVFSSTLHTYVAWVDVRGGNTEIYVARHVFGSGQWQELEGSASGGGISIDVAQSRRPTIAVIPGPNEESSSDDTIVVSWTRIDDEGKKTIETAAFNAPDNRGEWSRFGSVQDMDDDFDHPQLLAYSDDSVVLGYLKQTDDDSTLMINQFTRQIDFTGFLSQSSRTHFPIDTTEMLSVSLPVVQFDLAVADDFIAVGVLQDDGSENKVSFHAGRSTTTYTHTDFLPLMIPPPPVPTPFEVTAAYFGHAGMPNVFDFGEFDVDDDAQVAIAVGKPSQITVQNETIFAPVVSERSVRSFQHFELQAAWQSRNDRRDEVIGFSYDSTRDEADLWKPWVRDTTNDPQSLSDTIGYAGQPVIDQHDSALTLAWVDESVHRDGAMAGSIFTVEEPLMVLTGSPVNEGVAGEGVSETGGVIPSLSVAHGPGQAALAWTELLTGSPQVFLRTDLEDHNVREFPFQNRRDRYDVNDDGEVTPLDALQVINDISLFGVRALPRGLRPSKFFDSSGDNMISPLDALQVINRIALRIGGESESELATPLGGANAARTIFNDDPWEQSYDEAIGQLF